MDVKQAVKTAKAYVADLFEEDGVVDLGLEEVEHDDGNKLWRVTVGFSRPLRVTGIVSTLLADTKLPRLYRVVAINDGGELVSVKLRDGTPN
jgi:hypothetical protein